MAVKWSKIPITQVNPLDGTSESVLEVNSIEVNGIPVREHLTFPADTDDATIQLSVESYLAKRGYDVADPSSTTLIGAIKLRSYQFKLQVTAYIGAHYDAGQQNTINGLWNEANSKGYVNRQAKCQKIMDWVNSVLTYFYEKLAELSSKTTIHDVQSVTMDLAQFDATDPRISIKAIKETTD